MGKRGANYRKKRDEARATPDIIKHEFDLTDRDFKRKLRIWAEEFHKKMLVKHGLAEDFEIKVDWDENDDSQRHATVVLICEAKYPEVVNVG